MRNSNEGAIDLLHRLQKIASSWWQMKSDCIENRFKFPPLLTMWTVNIQILNRSLSWDSSHHFFFFSMIGLNRKCYDSNSSVRIRISVHSSCHSKVPLSFTQPSNCIIYYKIIVNVARVEWGKCNLQYFWSCPLVSFAWLILQRDLVTSSLKRESKWNGNDESKTFPKKIKLNCVEHFYFILPARITKNFNVWVTSSQRWLDFAFVKFRKFLHLCSSIVQNCYFLFSHFA